MSVSVTETRKVKRSIKLALCGVAVSCFTLCCLWTPHQARAQSIDQDMSRKLVADLEDFAKRNSLSDEQLQRLLGDTVLFGRDWAKGGVGIIDKNTYVLLDGGRKRLLLGPPGSRKAWKGGPSTRPQIVITDGKDVLASMTPADLSALRIVIFSTRDVRFIDLSNDSGGRYLRENR